MGGLMSVVWLSRVGKPLGKMGRVWIVCHLCQ
jgi:hypothetical protein